MQTRRTKRPQSASRLGRKLIAAVSATALTCAVVVPVAVAKTVTVEKVFKLRPYTTTTYKLQQNPGASLADAGYILKGPNLSLREDNLVDPYPHQPHNVGQVTRDGVAVQDVGIGRVGATPPLEVRVKTGKLSGSFTITLYIKQQS